MVPCSQVLYQRHPLYRSRQTDNPSRTLISLTQMMRLDFNMLRARLVQSFDLLKLTLQTASVAVQPSMHHSSRPGRSIAPSSEGLLARNLKSPHRAVRMRLALIRKHRCPNLMLKLYCLVILQRTAFGGLAIAWIEIVLVLSQKDRNLLKP
jgi:hypothetical protein